MFVKPECPLLTCQVQSKEPEFKNHILTSTLFTCFVKLCNGFNRQLTSPVAGLVTSKL